jgi:phage gpG-like protein
MAVGGGFGISAAAGVGSLVFRMEVAGFEPVAVALSRFGASIQDFKPFWIEYFAPTFYRDVRRNFELEGSYVGGWAPLSPAYRAWKSEHYPGKTILRRTDALFRSLQFDGGQVGQGGIFQADTRALVLGTSIAYAAYHQLPTSYRSRGLLRAARLGVARRFLFLPRQAGSTFGRLLHAFAVDQADEAGLTVGLL